MPRTTGALSREERAERERRVKELEQQAMKGLLTPIIVPMGVTDLVEIGLARRRSGRPKKVRP